MYRNSEFAVLLWRTRCVHEGFQRLKFLCRLLPNHGRRLGLFPGRNYYNLQSLPCAGLYDGPRRRNCHSRSNGDAIEHSL